MQELKRQFDHFQITRGIACLMVFANHVCGRLSDALPKNAVESVLAPFLVPVGFPWVWLFLVLSGYLLAKGFITARHTLNWSGIKKFWLARLYRLMPLMLVASGLWMILFKLNIWSSALPTPQLLREIGIALSLPWVPYFQNTYAIGSSNSPAWSAVIEVHFSILLPLLLLIIGLSQRKMWSLTILWLLGVVISINQSINQSIEIFPYIYGGHLYNFAFFLAGCALALKTNAVNNFIKKISLPSICFLVLATILLIQYFSYKDLNITLALSPLLMLPVWCLLVYKLNDQYQVQLPNSWHQLINVKSIGFLAILEKFGVMSYTLYLLHKPISYILIDKLQLSKFVTGSFSLWLLTFFVLFISIPLYALFYLKIERKFRLTNSSKTVQKVH